MNLNKAISALNKLPTDWKKLRCVDCKMTVFSEKLIIIHKDMKPIAFDDKKKGWEEIVPVFK